MRVFVFSAAVSQGYLFLSSFELIFFFLLNSSTLRFSLGSSGFSSGTTPALLKQIKQIFRLQDVLSWTKLFIKLALPDCVSMEIHYCGLSVFTFRFLLISSRILFKTLCATNDKDSLKFRCCFYSSKLPGLIPHSLDHALIIPCLLERGNGNCLGLLKTEMLSPQSWNLVFRPWEGGLMSLPSSLWRVQEEDLFRLWEMLIALIFFFNAIAALFETIIKLYKKAWYISTFLAWPLFSLYPQPFDSYTIFTIFPWPLRFSIPPRRFFESLLCVLKWLFL